MEKNQTLVHSSARIRQKRRCSSEALNVKTVNTYFILPFSWSLPELLWRIKGLSERAGLSRAMEARLKRRGAGWLTLAGRQRGGCNSLTRFVDEGEADGQGTVSARPELENLWVKPKAPFSVIISFIC